MQIIATLFFDLFGELKDLFGLLCRKPIGDLFIVVKLRFLQRRKFIEEGRDLFGKTVLESP